MNVVVWARVSSREQREGYSIDAQMRLNRERAEREGWKVVKEFTIAESAKRGADRVEFNRMYTWVRQNARRQRIGAILAHKLDRVCRNMRDAVRMQELEDECGVRLAFVENQFGPGAAGQFSFNVMAAVAQYYSDNLQGEVIKGMDEKVRQGWFPGHAPYGYVNVKDRDAPIQPHPEESKAVMRIFQLYSMGDKTFKKMREILKREGFTYRPSQPLFGRTSISYILNNRFYIGEIDWKGTKHAGRHVPLVDRDTFMTCQDILKGRNRRTGASDTYLAGGLFRCRICGFAITGERIRRKLKGGGVREHVYYRCGNNHMPDDHPKVRFREEDLEREVLRELEAFKMPSERVREWFRETLIRAFDDERGMRLNRERMLKKRKSELEQMLKRLLDAYLSGMIEEDAYQTRQAELKTDAAAVERELDEFERIDPKSGETALSVFDFSQNLAEIWLGSNCATRREILDCISLNRDLSPQGLDIERRSPFDLLTEGAFVENGRGDRI